MLARNAEALYWIGRYVERADDTARILDVAVHQLLEDSMTRWRLFGFAVGAANRAVTEIGSGKLARSSP